MARLVDYVLNKQANKFNKECSQILYKKAFEKIDEIKDDVRKEKFDFTKSIGEESEDELDDDEELSEARIARKNRIRKGVIQRRKKVSNVKGFTLRGGKITRITTKERKNREIAQRKASIKRKGKEASAKRKSKIATRKRKALGFD